jgi:uncharacterized membrane protein
MIEWIDPSAAGVAEVRLRPPRALSARQFRLLFAVLAGAMCLVALFSWLVGGNAFAPLFALLDSALVAWALRWLWRLGERDEVIRIDGQAIEVRGSRQDAVRFRAHPYWVRVSEDATAVNLDCSGRRCAVGAFLGPEERHALVAGLRRQLAGASGRPPG